VSSAWHSATVTDRRPAGGGLTRVVLVPHLEVAGTHAVPGQYVEVRADGQTGYFVLSNDPGASTWELVMRAGGGASDVLLVIPVPAEVEVSAAIGSGFPVHDARGRELFLALGGTGIAAGPPVVRRRIRDGDARLTRVWVGARGDDLPLAAEIEAWRAAGAEVTVSGGFLDEAMRTHIAASPEAPIFAVGADAMVAALRTLAPGRVHTNHEPP
jgi:NAD(P)H-flavin reductase